MVLSSGPGMVAVSEGGTMSSLSGVIPCRRLEVPPCSQVDRSNTHGVNVNALGKMMEEVHTLRMIRRGIGDDAKCVLQTAHARHARYINISKCWRNLTRNCSSLC